MVKVEKVLKLQVTSETDSFFLHSLEINEDAFQRLKHDQSILVDFVDFPAQIIELLKECLDAKNSPNPKFLTVLSIGSEDSSVVGIVETNKFKHLCHISMKFQPGTDTTIKEYLSQRLAETRSARNVLQSKLVATSDKLETVQAEAESLAKELVDQNQLLKRQATEMKANQATLLTECREKAMRELHALKSALEHEKDDLEGRNRNLMDGLNKRNAELEDEVRALIDKRYALETKVSELTIKCASLERSLADATSECDALKRSNLDLDKSKHAVEKLYNQELLKTAAMAAQITEKDELIKALRQQHTSSETHSSTLQDSYLEMKNALARAEERANASANEVNKGNQIIDKLQNDLKASKVKAKLKSAVISQQENLLTEKQHVIDGLSRDATIAKSQMEGLEASKAALTHTVEEQKAKLEDSRKLLDQNQQMIQWLNNQINEAQVARYGGRSRFQFRPTSTTTQAKVNL